MYDRIFKIHPHCVNEQNYKTMFTNIFDSKLESHIYCNGYPFNFAEHIKAIITL